MTTPAQRKPARPLTARQSAVLEFIRRTIERTAQAPSVRQIGHHFRIRNVNGVVCHLLALEVKGKIERTPGVGRGIRLR